MKRLIVSIVLFFAFHTLQAQTFNVGDNALEESLRTLNEQVTKNPKDFIEVNLALRLNLPKDKLLNLLNKEKMNYSEVFLCAYISAKQGRDLDAILKDYKAKNKIWKDILFDYGIIKGNKEFKALLKATDNIHIKPWKPSPRK